MSKKIIHLLLTCLLVFSSLSLSCIKLNAAVGNSIADTFPDPNMAQAVAAKIANNDVNHIIDTADILNATNWNTGFNLKEIEDVSGIEHFTNLQQLNLATNKIITLPDDFSNLTNLQTLYLSENNFEIFPNVLLDLNINSLFLTDNHITNLPTDFKSLKNTLTILDLAGNELTTNFNNNGLASLATLQRLTLLNLANNALTFFPTDLTNLQQLTSLSLNHNQIVTIPDNIGNLSRLNHLYLQNNHIIELPTSILNLTNLISININYQTYRLPTKFYSDTLVIDNMIKNHDQSLIAPLTISHQGIYLNNQIIWSDLVNQADNLFFVFSQDLTINALQTTFGGTVIQPVAKRTELVSLNIQGLNDVTYDHGLHTPIPVIKNQENNDLIVNQDFTLTYQNNIDVGQASVIITGINAYIGTVEVYFNINKATPVVHLVPTATYLNSGDALSNSSLEDGIIHGVIPRIKTVNVLDGYFEWVNADTIVTANSIHEVRFIPYNINYETVTMMVEVRLNDTTIIEDLPNDIFNIDFVLITTGQIMPNFNFLILLTGFASLLLVIKKRL